MKLILAIMPDTDNDPVSQALIGKNFRVTCIASTGGFLRRGQATLLVGVDDDMVDTALEIIRTVIRDINPSEKERAFLYVVPVEKYFQL